MRRIHLVICFVSVLVISISCTDYSGFPYDLAKPIRTLNLTHQLREISGIQKLNDGEIAAIQDEKGKVYILDEKSGKINNTFDFGKKGDYEGVCFYNDTFYVLESNGSVHKIKKNKEPKTYKFDNNKGFDFEGICVDQKNERLLIACKDHGEKKKNDKIHIYAFSIEDKEYKKKAVFKIPKELVNKKFGASGIAIHPNGDIYILSSRTKTLLIISPEGEVKQITPLNHFVFRQPEGISFNDEGQLYISNEENNGPPTILVFDEKN